MFSIFKCSLFALSFSPTNSLSRSLSLPYTCMFREIIKPFVKSCYQTFFSPPPSLSLYFSVSSLFLLNLSSNCTFLYYRQSDHLSLLSSLSSSPTKHADKTSHTFFSFFLSLSSQLKHIRIPFQNTGLHTEIISNRYETLSLSLSLSSPSLSFSSPLSFYFSFSKILSYGKYCEFDKFWIEIFFCFFNYSRIFLSF